MRTSKSTLEKMNDAGIWNGPKDHLCLKLKFAYQLANNQAFIGVFEKHSFKSYPDYDTGHNTLYLGKPSEFFTPQIGRDKIRDADGNLKIIETEDEISSVPSKKKPQGTQTKPQGSNSVLVAYPLDHSRQKDIMHPSSFDGFDVQLSGVGPIGLEIAINLHKLGLKKLKIFDPLEVPVKDLAVGPFRIYDANRARGTVAYELIADQSMQEADINLKYLTGDSVGSIVINTLDSPDVRHAIWTAIKGKQGLFLDVQISGQSGVIYAINPQDPVSAELFEESLSDVYNQDTTIDIVNVVAGIATGAFRRYISSPGNERANCLDRLYKVDVDAFFRDQGVWSKSK